MGLNDDIRNLKPWQIVVYTILMAVFIFGPLYAWFYFGEQERALRRQKFQQQQLKP